MMNDSPDISGVRPIAHDFDAIFAPIDAAYLTEKRATVALYVWLAAVWETAFFALLLMDARFALGAVLSAGFAAVAAVHRRRARRLCERLSREASERLRGR